MGRVWASEIKKKKSNKKKFFSLQQENANISECLSLRGCSRKLLLLIASKTQDVTGVNANEAECKQIYIYNLNPPKKPADVE